jgi:hypothetical protein
MDSYALIVISTGTADVLAIDRRFGQQSYGLAKYMILESVVTCPHCTTAKPEPCRPMPAAFFTNASAVARCFGRSKVIVACFVPTARYRVRRFRQSVRSRPARLPAVRGNAAWQAIRWKAHATGCAARAPTCWRGGCLRARCLPLCSSRCRFEPSSGPSHSFGWGPRAF